MTTAQQLRSDAAAMRMSAHAAPDRNTHLSELAEAERLEHRASELEKTPEQRAVEQLSNQLKVERIRAERAEKRLEHREWLLAQIIGRPQGGMSDVAIGSAVHAVLGNLRTTA
jgi:hypothetical protein